MRALEARVSRLVKSGKAREALELLNQVPADAASSSFRRALLMGICYAKMGQLQESKRLFHMALRIRPGDPAALTGLGNLAVLAGEPGQAASFYSDALENCSWRVEPRYNLVLAYQEADQFEKSLSAYREFRLVSNALKWIRASAVAAVFFFLWFLFANR